MVEVQASNAADVLAYLHQRLDGHFRSLYEYREAIKSPVFALEHQLSEVDLQLLSDAVRAVVSWGLPVKQRRLWLPFVVYATELGYDYVGDKYWPPFVAATPGWEYQHRDWLRVQFTKFADSYGGVRPEGAFASYFPIISWPITNAVLPTYLQRHLAQLLYDFRTGLSSALLSDPDELGERLAVRAGNYTERFRIFCRNTELLGQVAAALLAGEDEDSPYLVRPVLDRIVGGLSREQQARRWLASARQSAHSVRSSGIKTTSRPRSAASGPKLPRATDPRFFLRLVDGAWHAYAEMPDLTVLSQRLPHVFDELENCRAEANGVRKKLATGRLTHSGQEVHFDTWPDPAKPFIQLEGGTEPVNRLMADQCAMTQGPWWLFRRQGAGLAIEVKSRVLRPGHRYLLVGAATASAPSVDWSQREASAVSGVVAYRLDTPAHMTSEDLAELERVGLSALFSVAVRPVGIVASGWDGEGAAEWLAGEAAVIGIRSELAPTRCLLSMSSESFLVDWPTAEPELVLSLEGVDVGIHEVNIALFDAANQELSSGSIVVTVRDPQIRPEIATPGEGIRLLASPARPTLDDLWDGNATVSIEGPVGGEAELHLSLRDGDGAQLALLHRKLELPVDEQAWIAVAKAVRAEPKFRSVYDQAESCELTVLSGGVGFASLTCERGFVPLRWRFGKGHDGSLVAVLSDRTGRDSTKVNFFTIESPLDAINYLSSARIELPARGGLLRATSDEAEVVAIAPTNPNAMRLTHLGRPDIPCGSRTTPEILRIAEGHRMWALAPVPRDAFAARQHQIAMDAFPRSIAMLMCGSHWANLERSIELAADPADYFDQMRNCVGVSAGHKALGDAIAYKLHEWLSLGTLLSGFSEVIASRLVDNSVRNQPTAARFLLTLAGRPGYILDWPQPDRDYLLAQVVTSPVLLRAARFAVLGTRILNDEESASGGF